MLCEHSNLQHVFHILHATSASCVNGALETVEPHCALTDLGSQPDAAPGQLRESRHQLRQHRRVHVLNAL